MDIPVTLKGDCLNCFLYLSYEYMGFFSILAPWSFSGEEKNPHPFLPHPLLNLLLIMLASYLSKIISKAEEFHNDF